MSVQVEKLEKNMAKLTIEVSAEQFKDAMQKAFNKNKNRFNIPGFRRGKAPMSMIEKMYGEGVFYEDAADEAINATCMDAMNESGLDIVSRPEVTVEQIGTLARMWGQFNREVNPAPSSAPERVEALKKVWSARRRSGCSGACCAPSGPSHRRIVSER